MFVKWFLNLTMESCEKHHLWYKVCFVETGLSFHSYFSHSRVLWVQPGSHNSQSHGDRTPQPGTDTAGYRKHRTTPGGMLGVDTHTVSVRSYKKICPLPASIHSVAISSVLYTLTFVTVGSPPAWLALTEACHMVATRAMDTVTPLRTGLTEGSVRTGCRKNTHEHLHSACDSRRKLFQCSGLFKTYCTDCFDVVNFMIPASRRAFRALLLPYKC